MLKNILKNKLVVATIACFLVFTVFAALTYAVEWAIYICMVAIVVAFILLGIILTKRCRVYKKQYKKLRSNGELTTHQIRKARLQLWGYRIWPIFCFLLAASFLLYLLKMLLAVMG